MFLTTHAAAGILISNYVHDPLAVFGLSFASHFVLDFIPHGDRNIYGQYLQEGPHRYRQALMVSGLDVAALMFLAAAVISQPGLPNHELMIIGILGSILPDLLSHFFPIIHERMSWLWVIRQLYRLTKPSGLRYFVRAQNWLHRVLHHSIIHYDVSFTTGLSIQIGLTAVFLALSF